eukprot:TRINITY_DN362_c1_g1_i1.p1 TRINITY_DN362_c1_g1~~TRINITY_DN362_c1_g1_i1.p1  ORF type:complete len:277 (+),score=76.59 TRINITY_DN362_c1_g1_i1:31-831(+)
MLRYKTQGTWAAGRHAARYELLSVAGEATVRIAVAQLQQPPYRPVGFVLTKKTQDTLAQDAPATANFVHEKEVRAEVSLDQGQEYILSVCTRGPDVDTGEFSLTVESPTQLKLAALYQASKPSGLKTFKCDGCGVMLTEYFEDQQGRKMCDSCFTVRKCVVCDLEMPNSLKVYKTFQDKFYHTDCFRCNSCKVLLTTPLVVADKLYCQQCGRLCTVCGAPVGVSCVDLEEKLYHNDCLRCAKCGKILDAEKGVAIVDDKYYCGDCS